MKQVCEYLSEFPSRMPSASPEAVGVSTSNNENAIKIMLSPFILSFDINRSFITLHNVGVYWHETSGKGIGLIITFYSHPVGVHTGNNING